VRIQRDDSLEEILGFVDGEKSVWLFPKKKNIFVRLYEKLFKKEKNYTLETHDERKAKEEYQAHRMRDAANMLYHRRYY